MHVIFTVLFENIYELENMVSRLDETQIVNKICEMVPDFRRNELQVLSNGIN
jgi:hypothetical protein